jgi:hypothetical protein
MIQKKYHVDGTAALVVVMVAFLFAILFATANLSFAESGKKKSSVVARESAVEYAEAQIKQLQDSLTITEAQEKLWSDLTQVMRENAKDMDALTKDRAEIAKPMNALEHLKFHRQITEAHLAQLQKLIPPFEALYASMSDEQKTITDTIFRTGKHEKRKRK